MIFSLTWMPDVLEKAGLKVAETAGWRSRGRAEMGTVRGVMCHHTATRQPGNMPSLNLLVAGRAAAPGSPALPGPLAQLGLGRDGTYYVIAAGRANHAGQGSWEGIATGNSSFIGIEAENNGVDEPWPKVQIEAYQRGVAALLDRIRAGANMCCGHKEFALPSGRKADPDFDMPAFRSGVASYLAGRTPPPPIPSEDDRARPTLRRGASGDGVRRLQRALGIESDGAFGGNTEAALRAFQRAHDLVPDGILGPRTWALLPDPDAAAAVPASGRAPAVPPAPTAAPAAMPVADDAAHPPRLAGNVALTPDGQRFAVRSRGGFYTSGETSLRRWLAGLSQPPAAPPVVRVLKAVSLNEGRLEAVNSYDNAHLSFGMFQWTAGSGDGPGELAVLLARFQAADKAGFDDCFGQYGLRAQVKDVDAVSGNLLLDGRPLDTDAEKNLLRGLVWAYRFWRAGHHPGLRQAEFALAAARIDRFRTARTLDRPLDAWIRSELGIALILDEHVNRPGHVPRTLATAIGALGGAPPDPTRWTTDDEHTLIEAYIAARADTDMTESTKRAERIMDLVRSGDLSEARGSFA